MGTLRGDNGGDRPQEGNGLPGLPPEWGTIIIPDDASALDEEGAPLRRQFRRTAFRRRWRRRLHLPPEPATRTDDDDNPGLAIPLLIMSVAVVATMVSLFAVAWPSNHRARPSRPASAQSHAATVSLAQVTLTDAAGSQVRVRDLAPAVVLLVDGCGCEQLVSSTVSAVAAHLGPTGPATSGPAVNTNPPVPTSVDLRTPVGPTVPNTARISVLVVAATLPALPSGLDPSVVVRSLADPNRTLRAALPTLVGSTGTGSAILLTRDAAVLRALNGVTVATDFQQDLARLRAG